VCGRRAALLASHAGAAGSLNGVSPARARPHFWDRAGSAGG
jgi:hypothetical protein